MTLLLTFKGIEMFNQSCKVFQVFFMVFQLQIFKYSEYSTKFKYFNLNII